MEDNTYSGSPSISDNMTVNITMLFAVYTVLAVCAYYIKKTKHVRPLHVAEINSMV